MAKKPETKFKEKVINDLKKVPNCWFTKIQQLAKSGDPDIVCCVNGLFVGIELKRNAKERPSPLQAWVLEAIAESGGIGCVACPENWSDILSQILNVAYGNADSPKIESGNEIETNH